MMEDFPNDPHACRPLLFVLLSVTSPDVYQFLKFIHWKTH